MFDLFFLPPLTKTIALRLHLLFEMIDSLIHVLQTEIHCEVCLYVIETKSLSVSGIEIVERRN